MKKTSQKSRPNHVSQHDYIKLGIEWQFIPHIPTKARLEQALEMECLAKSKIDISLEAGA
jgi:hypothetical protein